ncbi:MAG: hypothetical protein K8S87_05660 [Planctomycetes bacterium]|nr:hypothetical protein [Planctomycetota bacterium]
MSKERKKTASLQESKNYHSQDTIDAKAEALLSDIGQRLNSGEKPNQQEPEKDNENE